MTIFKISRKELDQLDDLTLIERYKQHRDMESAGELFKRYTHLVFGVCLKYLKNETDSKDAVMLIFEKLLVDLPRFEIRHFKSWLYQVTRNHCLMILRQRQNEQRNSTDYHAEFGQEFMENADFGHLSQENVLETKKEKLPEAIAQLKPEQQVCIERFYLQEKSYQQIAQETGYPVKKVKSYIQNGKRNLRNLLGATVWLILSNELYQSSELIQWL